MSNFLRLPRYVVHVQDNSGNSWVPGLFDRGSGAYLLVGESLEEMISLIQDGGATLDSDPFNDLRVVDINSLELYALKGKGTTFVRIDPDSSLVGPDKSWFEFN